jgi:hypothetical protein
MVLLLLIVVIFLDLLTSTCRRRSSPSPLRLRQSLLQQHGDQPATSGGTGGTLSDMGNTGEDALSEQELSTRRSGRRRISRSQYIDETYVSHFGDSDRAGLPPPAPSSAGYGYGEYGRRTSSSAGHGSPAYGPGSDRGAGAHLLSGGKRSRFGDHASHLRGTGTPGGGTSYYSGSEYGDEYDAGARLAELAAFSEGGAMHHGAAVALSHLSRGSSGRRLSSGTGIAGSDAPDYAAQQLQDFTFGGAGPLSVQVGGAAGATAPPRGWEFAPGSSTTPRLPGGPVSAAIQDAAAAAAAAGALAMAARGSGAGPLPEGSILSAHAPGEEGDEGEEPGSGQGAAAGTGGTDVEMSGANGEGGGAGGGGPEGDSPPAQAAGSAGSGDASCIAVEGGEAGGAVAGTPGGSVVVLTPDNHVNPSPGGTQEQGGGTGGEGGASGGGAAAASGMVTDDSPPPAHDLTVQDDASQVGLSWEGREGGRRITETVRNSRVRHVHTFF